ncbi:MAG TPA: sigma-54-dependent Fis family transcriptional regulator [Planctomycetes bacterium]|nr:sigma-54-dependent Fis family transcriptional regulator [Planctomycetota bacterium]
MKSLWKPRILVCDDQQRQRDIVADILTGGGYRVSTAESLGTALEVFDSAIEGGDPFDLVLTDLKMPNSTEGLDLLRQVKERHERSEVILMTAYATVQTALEAGRFDAYAYLEKPFDRTGLLHVVRRAEEKLRLVLDNERLRQLVNPHDSFHGIVGESVRMRELTELIRRVAVTDATCLVRGDPLRFPSPVRLLCRQPRLPGVGEVPRPVPWERPAQVPSKRAVPGPGSQRRVASDGQPPPRHRP